MLKPAQLYQDRLQREIIGTWYKPENIYWNGGQGSCIPELPDNNYDSHRFVSVDKHDNILGYICYAVDWSAMSANEFGIISFKKNSLEFAKDVFETVCNLFEIYHMNRIQWCAYEDNPAIKAYRRFIKKHGGREYVKMTREELNQLNSLKREIIELEAEITRLRQRKSGTATDKVRASGQEYPYINGFKQISGLNMAAENRRKSLLERKEFLLNQRKEKAEAAELKIMEYINSVQDSKIRMIMQYRYINGYRWEKIGRLLNYDRTYPKKLIDQYLESQ